jgi:hypothetical protein
VFIRNKHGYKHKKHVLYATVFQPCLREEGGEGTLFALYVYWALCSILCTNRNLRKRPAWESPPYIWTPSSCQVAKQFHRTEAKKHESGLQLEIPFFCLSIIRSECRLARERYKWLNYMTSHCAVPRACWNNSMLLKKSNT